MGSGFKDFAAGDILTANDVDGYLMRQTVMTFADASARDSALSGVLDEGMMAYLENTNRTTYYDGSAWQDIAKSSSIGTWTAYTPTWTANGGTPTLGNGTLTAEYLQVNDLVHVRLFLTWGSTTSATATTEWRFTFPVASAHSIFECVGSVLVHDANFGYYRGVAIAVSSTTFGAVANESASTVGSIVPMTWTTDDKLSFILTYKAA